MYLYVLYVSLYAINNERHNASKLNIICKYFVTKREWLLIILTMELLVDYV